jgi:putative ABC transport system permease protein
MTTKRPPRWPIDLLRLLCKPGFVEEIEGDLEEDFGVRLERKGRTYANLMFCAEALAFIRPGMLRSSFRLIQTTMIQSYMTMFYRGMIKKPLITLINLFGLTVGLASVVVIVGYVLFMLSYDRQSDNARNIYRVTMRWLNNGVEQQTADTFAPVAIALDESIHSVAKTVRVYPYSGLVSRDGVDKVRESRFCYADSLFFELFPTRARRGTLSHALTRPNSVVLTESMAIKYYGSLDIVGEELLFEDERGAYRFNITAVIEDVPQNMHLNPDFLASMTTLDKIMPWYKSWHYPSMYVYVEATDGYNPEQLTSDIDRQVTKTHPHYIPDKERDYFIQPVTDIYLHSNLANEWQANSNYVYVQVLIIVAGLILFLACVNYVNLSTARAAERAREVGMRKVMGAVRRQLVAQFLGESFVTALLAMVLATGLAELIFRLYLSDLLEKNLSINMLFDAQHVLAAIGGLVLLTLVAGTYPAFFLSAYRPASMLRGSGSKTKGVLTLQRSMVVFQFVVSCLLIIGMLIIQRQTTYMRDKRLGFEKDALVAIRIFDRKMAGRYETLKDQLLAESAVSKVAISSAFPMREGFFGWDVTPEGHTADEHMSMKSLSGDLDIIKALNLEVVDGRDFSHENASDTTQAFIINAAAARLLDWNDPVGKDFELTFYTSVQQQRKGKVIGVVKDFHFESLYNRIDPLVIFVSTHPYYCEYLLVKLAPGDLINSVRTLESQWKRFSADKPFEYFIADDGLASMYKQESRLSSMFTWFTTLSILISCLGLFGISAYTVSRRVKEISIRKVLGASVINLFALLSREYVLLILLAQVFTWPLAWWFANEWLSGFAYKVDLPVMIFLGTLAAGLVLGLISVSLHVFRAVTSNPSETLKVE